MGRESGGYPQTPTREAQPLWTLCCFQWGFTRGEAPLAGLGGAPQPPSQFPQVPSLGQEWGTKGVERTIFVATAKEIWAKGELLAPKRRLGY